MIQLHEPTESSFVVELRAGKVPGLSGWFADHHWFLILRGVVGRQYETCDGWEVWQYPQQGEQSWDHLHKNLLTLCQCIGHGPSRSIRGWIGSDASDLITKIENAPSTSPFCEKCGYWPGPDSNTFAQWVLSCEMRLGMRAVGKRYQLPRNAV